MEYKEQVISSKRKKDEAHKLHIFSFFSGCGLLDLGFEACGYSIDFVNEFSPSFLNAYRYAREQLKVTPPKYGYSNEDVTIYLSQRSEELRKNIKEVHEHHGIVGFIGGPPCPDFSVAGKQKGKDGENGKLSQTYVKLIMAQQPDFFLFENVKGLWKTAKHRAFYEELKEQLHQSGYITTERLCNSLEFAVPQDRDRILLFGINKNILTDKAPTIDDFPWAKYIRYNFPEIKRIGWPETNPFEENTERICPNNIPQELTIQYWFNQNDVENHPNGNEHFNPRQGLQRMMTVEEGDVSRKSHKRLHRWRYSPTAAYGNNEVHLHPYKARRLSVAETLAIQSLPKDFVLPPEMSLTDKFKTIGNGVPFLMAKSIAQTISDYINELIKDDKLYRI